jgi:ribose-phosphate pyrophosphokinase
LKYKFTILKINNGKIGGEVFMQNHFKLFALSGSKHLGLAIATALKVPLSPVDITKFADGEVLVKPLETVRNQSVYIVQSTSKPASENLMELMVFIDSLKRSSAKEIIAVIPYFGYARQDRVARSREPITARLVADLLLAAGVDRVMSVDIHTMQIQGFFSIPFDNISPYHLFANEIKQLLTKNKLGEEDLVIVSPDHGSVTRARNFAEMFRHASIGIIDKRRPKPNLSESISLIGDVNGKIAVVVDDIVDTGNTLLGATDILKKSGAKMILVCATHAIFSGNAFEKIQAAPIDSFFITDTIDRVSQGNIKVVSVAPLLARVIENMHEGKALSPIFDEFSR